MLYNKLVRDKIPQIIIRAGKNPIIRTLSDDELPLYLEMKLEEEVKEYRESKKPEELADILEVIVTLAKIQGLSFEDLMILQADKRFRNGGFNDKILLIETETPDESNQS